MRNTLPSHDSKRADFGDLRDAYMLLSDIISCGGFAEKKAGKVFLKKIPSTKLRGFLTRLEGRHEALGALLSGQGEKKSLDGCDEVVFSVIGRPSLESTLDSRDDHSRKILDICLLKVRARGTLTDALSISTDAQDWKSQIANFVDWNTITGIICAADGNNQRAAIGAILTACKIGRGKLPMIEMEVPQEIDESTHLVRGAEWMKAGLTRFHSASSEALWYLIRARSLHSRMFKERKQGFYTSMGLLAFTASGLTLDEISKASDMPASLIEKMTEIAPAQTLDKTIDEFIQNDIFRQEKPLLGDAHSMKCAHKIWRGPAIYLKGMKWRMNISHKARESLYQGADLVEISETLKIQRRELVRILSQSFPDMESERDRFKAAIPKPEAFRLLLS